MDGGGLLEALVVLGSSAVFLWSAVTIVDEAGDNGWWALLLFVPIANLAALLAFARADWPALRDARRADPA